MARYLVGLVFMTLVVSACAPAAPLPSEGSQSPASLAVSSPDRTLVFVSGGEPVTLSFFKPLQNAGLRNSNALNMFNGGLYLVDERGESFGSMAENIPQLNTDTWKVFPDGRMETTYRLRPNITWHDGTPFHAEDIVFSLRVAQLPGIGISAMRPAAYMEESWAPDARTFVIRWNQTYAGVADMEAGDFIPLPRHILEKPFQELDPRAFLELRYWSDEFVGTGPYKLARWERGAFIEASAHDGYSLGKPKVDRIKIIFAADPNVAVTYLLSGEAHVAIDAVIGFEQGMLLKEQWARDGTVIFTPSNVRYVATQVRDGYTDPKILLDLRVRKALAHAIDRQALVDNVLAGQSRVADTMVPPTLSFYATVDRTIAKYPFDPSRTQQLLADVGMVRGADGFYAMSGERFSPELRGVQGGIDAQENAILVDGWRRVGIEAFPRLVSRVENTGEVQATFPALGLNAFAADTLDTILLKLLRDRIGTAANRWAGSNRSGWSHPEFDRLYNSMVTTLDDAEMERSALAMLKMASEDLPLIPMYYELATVGHAVGLMGPKPRTGGGSHSNTWNVHEWYWQ
jgi:peptide/nickel transport system substrate-binding protein